MCGFKHRGDLGDLWHLLEPSELISNHGQVGAWSLVDIMAIDMDKFIVEVALEWAWPPLRSGQREDRCLSPGRRICPLGHLDRW